MGSESESDNESPEVVSTSSMKSQREQEFRELSTQKQKNRDELKLKRKLKIEKLISQKKEKQAKLEAQNAAMKEEELSPAVKEIPVQEQPEHEEVEQKKASGHRKMYPKYNVVVEPLTKLRNPRAASALSFKEKRMAKVPRENVAEAIISYKEKLRVKNT